MAATMLIAIADMGAAQERYTEHTLTLDGGPAQTADCSRFHWLPGHWQGRGLGGEVDEFWTSPAGGSMVGVFRLRVAGEPKFYEILWMTCGPAGTAMHVKHFTEARIGWEPRDGTVAFPLVRLEPDAECFDDLSYRLVGGDSLEVFVATKRGDRVEEAGFVFSRVPDGANAIQGCDTLRFDQADG
jgi:hypothetical protein